LRPTRRTRQKSARAQSAPPTAPTGGYNRPMRLASLAVIVALSLVSALAVSAFAGCSREARPAAQPGEQAPLPPTP